VIWHPLVWAFWAAALSGSLLYAVAAARAMDVAVNWSPMQADPDQLARERHAETLALLGHGSLVCLTAAALMGLTGIALVWHRIVPGAMCGTGVLQAMGISGRRAMLFWGLTLILLYGWQVLDRLDRHHPQGVLIPADARLLITAAPFLALSLVYSWQALMRVEAAPFVSCCAAVYDRVLSNAAGSAIRAGLTSAALWGSLAGGVVLPVAALWAAIRDPHRNTGMLIAATATGWGVLAAIAVKHFWSAYYYQVLSHPCPWCLFLPDYHGAGFFIFACLAIVPLEGVAFWAADHTRRRYPVLAEAADRRCRQAAWRIMAAIIGFILLTVGPALAWRLHTGVWMDGS
jgi:hypothetical protein